MRSDYRLLFGQRLAQLRKQKNWSQEHLALESDMARSYLGGVEHGQRNIALLKICKLTETLNLPAHELLRFEIQETPQTALAQPQNQLK